MSATISRERVLEKLKGEIATDRGQSSTPNHNRMSLDTNDGHSRGEPFERVDVPAKNLDCADRDQDQHDRVAHFQLPKPPACPLNVHEPLSGCPRTQSEGVLQGRTSARILFSRRKRAAGIALGNKQSGSEPYGRAERQVGN